MRSFFFRIFFSFWAAMTLIGAGFVLVAASDDHSARRERFEFLASQALQHEAERSALFLERGEVAQAHQHWRALEEKLLLNTQLLPLQELATAPAAIATELQPLAQSVLHKREPSWQSFERYHAYVDVLPRQAPTHLLVVQLPRPAWWSFLGNPTPLLLRLLIVVGVSGLVCWALARHFTQPITLLRDATRRLASGETDTRVGPALSKRNDEIGALGQDFDAMAQRIDALLAAQKQLLGDVSHELRSPLARLNVALALARQKSGPEAESMLDRIEKESERLASLIGEILTLTQVDNLGQPYPMTAFSLSDLVREVAADADFEGQARDKRVTVDALPEVELYGAPALLRRAIDNVLRNALRHTPTHSAVTVRVEVDPGSNKVRLCISDQGPGVPPASLTEIFRPFVRVEAARDRHSGGVGIGLAIAESAVRRHNGRIWAENLDGRGLAVCLELPCQDT